MHLVVGGSEVLPVERARAGLFEHCSSRECRYDGHRRARGFQLKSTDSCSRRVVVIEGFCGSVHFVCFFPREGFFVSSLPLFM